MAVFQLVNLEGSGAFVFHYFPRVITMETRANWSPQNVTSGVKPLYFGNREPMRLSFEEMWLDKTTLRQSIESEIAALQALQAETERGTPPALQAIWGERAVRCVLEDLRIEIQLFDTDDGFPLRARVSMALLQLQENGFSNVRILDDDGGPQP
jgi:hypothetical protein